MATAGAVRLDAPMPAAHITSLDGTITICYDLYGEAEPFSFRPVLICFAFFQTVGCWS